MANNGEHATRKVNPDYVEADIKLTFDYARRAMRTVLGALGEKSYSKPEKCTDAIHPNGWDIDNTLGEYSTAGEKYKQIVSRPEPVLWDREPVLALVLATIQDDAKAARG